MKKEEADFMNNKKENLPIKYEKIKVLSIDELKTIIATE